jgi:hypothetical protein
LPQPGVHSADLRILTNHQDVGDAGARWDGADAQAGRDLGGQVLERVDGEVDAAFEESGLDLLGEPGLAVEGDQGLVGEIATGLDDLQLDAQSLATQLLGDPVCLRAGESTAARAESQNRGPLSIAIAEAAFDVLCFEVDPALDAGDDFLSLGVEALGFFLERLQITQRHMLRDFRNQVARHA